jgi:flagellum-specific ATP synthase
MSTQNIIGFVDSVKGLSVVVRIDSSVVSIGSQCYIESDHRKISAEVIGFDEHKAFVMTYHPSHGIHPGDYVFFQNHPAYVYPDTSWIGRVLNALLEPIDGKGGLAPGSVPIPIYNTPPSSFLRQKVKKPIDVGVRTINTFLTCCEGQRMGIFAGSGVGKSTLMSMLARQDSFDVCVICLIGERGKEVRDFIEDTLGQGGLERSIMIVSTSNETPLMRRQAAYTAMAVCEYFRDQGMNVLCLMDTITRFAMAMREIGLSVGEPPTVKGYPPSVFAELPKILERAGPGEEGKGYITAFITVLVDGDDHNEPIADAVRGILDGHIILSRHIAIKGRFPAIDILKSISRTMPHCQKSEHYEFVKKAKKYLSIYEDIEDLVRLGAYQEGQSKEVDTAIAFQKDIVPFLSQDIYEITTIDDDFECLRKIVEKFK